MLKSLFQYQYLIVSLACRELRARYVGTVGGILWTFIHPVLLMAVFYVVFSLGFKATGPRGVPFTLWFVCGMVPWLFFSDTLHGAASSVVRSASLIKKTVFPSEVLPVAHVVAGIVTHGVFLITFFVMVSWSGVILVPARLLVVWFLCGLALLLIGLGWLLAAIQVFYRDVTQFLAVIVNIWFWVTPIVWYPEMLPPEYRSLLFLNPMYYVVEGYRGILIGEEITWPEQTSALVFWGTVIAVLAIGATIFRRLKPAFADVL